MNIHLISYNKKNFIYRLKNYKKNSLLIYINRLLDRKMFDSHTQHAFILPIIRANLREKKYLVTRMF
jgi:hypothetical protein